MVDWNRRARVANSILETAGLTPMVWLRRVVDRTQAQVLAKLEYFGPSGSVKDRILPYIVAEAERRGELRAGMGIIEGTTGNTGIATAMVAAARGYPCTIVMPEGMSQERQKVIRAYGAELVLTPGGESDVDLVVEKVAAIKAERPGQLFEVGQFANPDNPLAHYAATGPEIWEQTEGRVAAFVASQGTGGTLTGVARYLKAQNPQVKVYAVEPVECAILSGGTWGSHRIEGIGDGFVPAVLELDVLDGVVAVHSDEAIEMAARLAREEGIFCGISSGCNVVGALKVARAHPELATIVTLVNDNGLRYLSTELCGEPQPALASPERSHELSPQERERLAQVRLEVIR
ncbi:MAG: cysteine synthase A [Chloroflexi bacterium]|nr:cysteine synthase A [Chloroflexota bacterium]